MRAAICVLMQSSRDAISGSLLDGNNFAFRLLLALLCCVTPCPLSVRVAIAVKSTVIGTRNGTDGGSGCGGVGIPL